MERVDNLMNLRWISRTIRLGLILILVMITITPQDSIKSSGDLFANSHASVGTLEKGKTKEKVQKNAALPYQVKDINQAGDSNPENLADVDGTLFFSSDDGTHGYELWRSEGEESSTVIVKNINSASSSFPMQLTNVNGTLFFSAIDDENGRELWKSDGTELGTVMVKDINPIGSSDPLGLININGSLFFFADNGTHGRELWISNGTQSGTEMIKDINTTGSSNPAGWYLTDVNGTLFFMAYDGIHGNELWKSDGTSPGTVIIKDINPGPDSSMDFYRFVKAVDDMLYLVADDGSHGFELWKSDGTEIGTILVKDIGTGPGGSIDCFYGCFTSSLDGKLFFNLGNGPSNTWDLWESDGTEAGTKIMKDITLTSLSNENQNAGSNDKFYFSVDDGIHGSELWVSDGTQQATSLAKDINPYTSSRPRYFVNISGNLYFNADDGDHGRELWFSDGTESGTEMVMDILVGEFTIGSDPAFLTISGSMLYFQADSGGAIGYELWALFLGLMNELTLNGEIEGEPGIEYRFSADIGPADAVTPITYEWQATDQQDVTHSGGLTDTVKFSWDTPGTKKVSVRANNGVNELHKQVEIDISKVYLEVFIPFVVRR